MGIILSEKYGVNPSVSQCFFCLQDDCVVLFGTGYKKKNAYGHMETAEAPHSCGVINMSPCNKCQEFMKAGIIIITVRGDDWDKIENDRLDWKAKYDSAGPRERENMMPFIPNPYRTGGFFVIKEDAVRRMPMKDPKVLENILRHRWMFMEDEVARKMGLFDMGEINNMPKEEKHEGCNCGAACGCHSKQDKEG